ncbi:hypothetical protein, unknown function [Leishmania tarentolae]|uniref:Uncharacterized protein n=1 Tax=Leishmania tarentolae TaxID=5689 RepID=A0A640KLW2_LEITA|nr:hypothetical protein, unknown function [Leishmania tarentolae]
MVSSVGPSSSSPILASDCRSPPDLIIRRSLLLTSARFLVRLHYSSLIHTSCVQPSSGEGKRSGRPSRCPTAAASTRRKIIQRRRIHREGIVCPDPIRGRNLHPPPSPPPLPPLPTHTLHTQSSHLVMTQTVDKVLLEWLEATPQVPRRERQTLLLKELMSLHALQDICLNAGESGKEAEQRSWRDNHSLAEAKVSAALRRTFLDIVDTGAARGIAESLSVSTDVDMLYGALDTHCIMLLHVTGDGPRRPVQKLCGVEDIINELSEFQESVLLLRVDLTSSTQNSPATSSPPTQVGGVSQVKSWVEQCTAELEIGTQVTYYTDVECSHAFFDVRSVFLFSADGAKVERISRELLPRGGHDLNDVLRGVRFGGFCVM